MGAHFGSGMGEPFALLNWSGGFHMDLFRSKMELLEYLLEGSTDEELQSVSGLLIPAITAARKAPSGGGEDFARCPYAELEARFTECTEALDGVGAEDPDDPLIDTIRRICDVLGPLRYTGKATIMLEKVLHMRRKEYLAPDWTRPMSRTRFDVEMLEAALAGRRDRTPGPDPTT